jgi:DNA replication and repair protein RecF
MIAGCLKAVNFRNLEEICFKPCAGVNVLYGDNAQGKTNLIEALWLFTGSRSFRGSRDSEFIKFNNSYARLSLDFISNGEQNNSTITISDTKQATLNGLKLDSVSGLSGHFCAVVFSPDHLNLVKGGPQNRRNFIDGAITEIFPRYSALVSEYKNVLRQRNTLLKDIPLHSELLDTLSVWDEKLAKCGASIIFTRLRYLKKLTAHSAEIYKGIASSPENGEIKEKNEELKLEYSAFGGLKYLCEISDSREAVSKIKDELFNALTLQHTADIENGCTCIGPHRDDIKVSISGIDARVYASQGQQRSAVLALKLSEAAVLTESVGEPPVLLLDDVMSELDRFRQRFILNNIGGCQVFITCCDPYGLDEIESESVFKIKNGRIISAVN